MANTSRRFHRRPPVFGSAQSDELCVGEMENIMKHEKYYGNGLVGEMETTKREKDLKS